MPPPCPSPASGGGNDVAPSGHNSPSGGSTSAKTILMTTQVKARPPEAAPVRAVRLGPRDVVSQRRDDGTILLTSPHALAPYPAKLTERLEHWAAAAPARTFLAQRAPSGWRKLARDAHLRAPPRCCAA